MPEQVIDTDKELPNTLGSYRPVSTSKPNAFRVINAPQSGVTYNVVRRELDPGVCAAYTLLWIRRTLELGDLTSFDQFGNKEKLPMQLEIAQGAYDFWVKSGSSDTGRTWLFEANNLKAVSESKRDFFDKDECRDLMRVMLKDFGCYYFSITSEYRKEGHAVGFRTGPTALYFFDCNEGLFKYTDPEEYVKKVGKYLWGAYKDSLYPGKVATWKCVLD